MTKNFYITYYSNKDKKHITRRIKAQIKVVEEEIATLRTKQSKGFGK